MPTPQPRQRPSPDTTKQTAQTTADTTPTDHQQPSDPNAPQRGSSTLVKWLADLLPDSPREKQRKIVNLILSEDPDLRREAILLLASDAPATWKTTPKILENRATGDPDPQVRAAAVQVYAKLIESPQALELLKKTAKDRDRLVRCETILALKERPCPDAQQTLLLLLENDPEPVLRALAAQALANFPDKQVVRALIAVVDDDYFALAYRARKSLNTLTGRDFDYDPTRWNQWYFDTENVVCPTPSDNN